MPPGKFLTKSWLFLLPVFLLRVAYPVELTLSIDDIPGKDGSLYSGVERAQRLASIFKEHKVPSMVFYVNSGHVPKSYLKQILDIYAPFGEFGNHTHLHKSLATIGINEFRREVVLADRVLTEVGHKPKYFRYPYLEGPKDKKGQEQMQLLFKQLGYLEGHVTIDTFDWYFYEEWQKAKRAVNISLLKSSFIDFIMLQIQRYETINQKYFQGKIRHVLLLHENDLTALALGDIIKQLKQLKIQVISGQSLYPIFTSVAENNLDRGELINQALDKGYVLENHFKPEALKKEITQIFEKKIFSKKTHRGNKDR